jgi:hypothetical protein
MQNATPARLYALVFGVVLVAAGIIGFFSLAVAIWGFIVGDGDSSSASSPSTPRTTSCTS